MRKTFFAFYLLLSFSLNLSAQTARGVRIGFIDMEYILQNVPDYAEAKNQLELKAQKWKQEAETKKNEITRLKESLKTEKPLLTKELIEEREEDITFLETDLSDFQQKKFGPTGELITQKAVLIQPIQDQVFTAVQDIAEARKYDFVFDKTSDLTMLFAAKRFDISDQVIRALSRTSRRSQLSKKEIKEEEKKEYEENLQDANPAMAERQKILDARKATRDSIVNARKAAAEEKRNAILAKRNEDKAAKAGGTTTAKTPGKAADTQSETTTGTNEKSATTATGKTNAAEKQSAARDSIVAGREAIRQQMIEERAKKAEERKKELEARKAKVLADREAAKKAKEEQKKATTDKDTVPPPEGTKP